MITTVAGRTFLKAFNQKYNKDYSAKEFFEREYFPLFFDHSKYLQWVTNSPFVQMKKGQKTDKLSAEERREKLENLYEKSTSGNVDASFAIGYPAAEGGEFASTSGQVSDILIDTGEEDVFYSWMGGALGIGVAGGYNLLIDDEKILLETFEGWKYYRKYLNSPVLERMRGNQINTWNGQWLTYRFGKDYDESFDYVTLKLKEIFEESSSLVEVNTVNWSNLFFSLSNIYPDKEIVAYIYSFGQTNKTIGFIPMSLQSGKRLKDVWQKLYGNPEVFDDKKFQSLYGMHIKRAAEYGSIGLIALQPDVLKKYMSGEKSLSIKKEEDKIIYQTYKTWLIAMLTKNKNEITDYTAEIAKMILAYRSSGKGNSRITLVEKELLQSKSKPTFLNHLTDLLADANKEIIEALKKLRDEVHLMTNEEFGYFLTLLKFDYIYYQKNS